MIGTLEKTHGLDDPQVAEWLAKRAMLLMAQVRSRIPTREQLALAGCASRARLVRRALTLMMPPPERLQGKTEEADLLYIRSIAISESTLGPEHQDLAERLHGRANVLFVQVRDRNGFERPC